MILAIIGNLLICEEKAYFHASATESGHEPRFRFRIS
jgi:hypothetical protein